MSQSIDILSSGNVTPLPASDSSTPVQTPEQSAVRQMLEERSTPISRELEAARMLSLSRLPEAALRKSEESTLATLAARSTEKPQPTPDEMRELRRAKLNETVQVERTDSAGQTRQAVQVEAPQTEQDAVEKTEDAKPNSAPVGQPDREYIDIEGRKVSEVEVDKAVFTLLKEYRNEIVNTERLTLEGLKTKQSHIKEILDSITEQKKHLTETDDPDLLTPIELRLMETQGQVDRAITSRSHLNERMAEIAGIVESPASIEEKIEKLCNFESVWRLGQEQTRVLQGFLSGDINAVENLLPAFEAGIGMVNEDFRDFSEGLSTALYRLFEEEFQSRSLTPPTQEAFRALTAHCFRRGDSPASVVPALLGGTAWASSPEHQSTLLKIFFDELASPPPADEGRAALLGQRMAYVDMIFQGASREFSDTALILKKMLCPGDEQLAELQHQSLMVGRALQEFVLEHQKNSSLQKKAVGHLANSSLSARSYLLTPALVKAFQDTTGLKKEDFNYHMAHAAVLQMRAMQAGILPGAKEALDAEVTVWCTELGLDHATARYAAELDARLTTISEGGGLWMRSLIGAGALFTRGLEGELAGARAGATVVKQARSSLPTFHAAEKTNAFYQTSGNYLAHEALDRTLADLTGIIDETRFARATGFEHNDELINANMRDRMTRLMDNMYARVREDSGVDLRQTEADLEAQRTAFLNDLRTMQNRSKAMQDLASSSRELVGLRQTLSENEALLAAMTADKKLVHLSWPHKHPERLRIAETVLEIEALRRDLEQADEGARPRIESNIGHLLESLRDVDPFSLTRSRNRDHIPDMDLLLGTMLPRARALHFFKARRTYDGIAMSEADLAMRNIRRCRGNIMENNRIHDRALKALVSRIGSTSIDTIRKTITAAVLKAFTESQQDFARFNLRSPAVQRQVKDQLDAWGLTLTSTLRSSLMRSTVESLINDDGTLREDKLKKLAGDELTLSGKLSLDSMKQRLREEENYSRFKAWRAGLHKEALGLIDDDRRRREGVRTLMAEAALPGSGFVYSRERGLNIDTGKKFSPIITKNTPLSVTNLASPLSVRLKAMAKDSLMVSNIGDGGYQVLLKGGMAASLGAMFKVELPNAVLPLEGDLHAEKEKGIALTFTSREDCEAFLAAFLDKEAGIRNADKKHAGEAQNEKNYDPDIWRRASQIRFVHGHSVSADLGVSAMFTLFGTTFGGSPVALSSSLTFKTKFSGGVTRSVEENALGQKITFSRSVGFSQIATIGTGATASETYVTLTGLNKAKNLSLAVRQDCTLVTGEKGIMPDTSMDYEFATGGLSGELICHMFMPEDVEKKIHADPAFATAFDKLVTGLPPTARLSLKCSLKASVLAEVRELMARARGMGSEEERHAAQKKVSELLADTASYRPSRIVVRNASPQDISKNWSPGLLAFQIARERSFLRMSSQALEIQLPD